MPIVGIESSLRDRARDRCRHRLEHEREAPGRLERSRVREQRERLLGRASLRLVPAEHRRRLRREPEVSHHRDAGGDDALDAGEHRSCALELDGVGARLLDEADRVAHRVLVRDLERPERHVRDDERPARAARHGAREDQHLLHRRRDRRLVAEHGHRGRVADENEVCPCLVGEPATGRVVRRHHHDRLPPRLHLGELGQRQLARGGGRGSRLLGSNAHGVSPSRGTLSMRRVEPTRTAPARTGGSKSAIST